MSFPVSLHLDPSTNRLLYRSSKYDSSVPAFEEGSHHIKRAQLSFSKGCFCQETFGRYSFKMHLGVTLHKTQPQGSERPFIFFV